MLITWEFLKNYNNSVSLPEDTRTKKVQKSYEKHLKKLKKNNIDVNKYLIDRLFVNNLDYIITINQYPYNLTSDIKHYILWINPKNNKKYSTDDLDKIIKDYMLSLDEHKFTEYIFFQNHIESRSVFHILHYQIFYK